MFLYYEKKKIYKPIRWKKIDDQSSIKESMDIKIANSLFPRIIHIIQLERKIDFTLIINIKE